MRQERIGPAAERVALRGRYGTSKLDVRRPLRHPQGRYIACLGGTETFGPGVIQPYPALLERAMGRLYVNLGAPHAGIGALLGDETLLGICDRAEHVILQATGAQGLGNRFYTVHPRRNDRFLQASPKLRALYPEIDFTDFCFLRHMLLALQDRDPERFALIREELRIAWAMRMRGLIGRLAAPVTLLVLPGRLGCGGLGDEPLFVSPQMVEALRPLVAGIVVMPFGRDIPAGARHRRTARALQRALTAEARGPDRPDRPLNAPGPSAERPTAPRR